MSWVVFFRVCVIPLRVWKSYTTYKGSGYGYGSLARPTEDPGRYPNVAPLSVTPPWYFPKAYPTPGIECRTELTGVRGTCNTPGMVLHAAYRAQHCNLYFGGNGSGSLAESTEIPGNVIVQNSQEFRVGIRMWYPYPYQHRDSLLSAYPYSGYCATGVQNYQ